MNWIFVEAQKTDTSECNFLKTVLSVYCPGIDYEFVCMDGVGNVFNETNVNKISQAFEEGDTVLVILDSDTAEKGCGFKARTNDVTTNMAKYGLRFPFFLYPNNNDDGDVETLMEKLARKDLHRKWWDCFEDYEKCVGGIKDDAGVVRYNLPNLKAKLHTFISAQKLSCKKRNKVGSGDWLFDNLDYWDISRPELKPLVDFLKLNSK